MFKENRCEIRVTKDLNMLLVVEEGVRDGMCHVVHRYAKANNKYMKNCDEKKEFSFLEYLDANNLYGWAMCQKLPISGFKWVRNVSRIDKGFIKDYDEDGDVGFFLKIDIEYPKELHDLHSNLPFLPEIMKINNCNKLVRNFYDKKSMLFT